MRKHRAFGFPLAIRQEDINCDQVQLENEVARMATAACARAAEEAYIEWLAEQYALASFVPDPEVPPGKRA